MTYYTKYSAGRDSCCIFNNLCSYNKLDIKNAILSPHLVRPWNVKCWQLIKHFIYLTKSWVTTISQHGLFKLRGNEAAFRTSLLAFVIPGNIPFRITSELIEIGWAEISIWNLAILGEMIFWLPKIVWPCNFWEKYTLLRIVSLKIYTKNSETDGFSLTLYWNLNLH